MQKSAAKEPATDVVAEKIEELLKPLADKKLYLGTYGNTIRRATSKDAKELVVITNVVPTKVA